MSFVMVVFCALTMVNGQCTTQFCHLSIDDHNASVANAGVNELIHLTMSLAFNMQNMQEDLQKLKNKVVTGKSDIKSKAYQTEEKFYKLYKQKNLAHSVVNM